MSITYPVFLPVSIKSDRFGLNINKSQFSGEFTRNRITQSHGAGTADRWEGVYTTPPLSREQHREMSALLDAMSVDDGTFLAFNPNLRTITGNFPNISLLGTDQVAEHIQDGSYTYNGFESGDAGTPIFNSGFFPSSIPGRVGSNLPNSNSDCLICNFVINASNSFN